MGVWQFIQDQILGMKWLNELIGGVPMYADIFGTIPAAEALLYKGAQIAAYGVMTTPALVVDGRVVSYGKILKKEEAKALIHNMRG